MKKLNSILSIISLCITSFLLVLLVFAWYATNKTANVESSVGATAVGKNLYLSTTYSGDSSFVYDESTFDTYWSTQADLTASNILLPVSTFDATNFYYTTEIDENGAAIHDGTTYNFNYVSTSTSYYYVAKKIYLCTSEPTNMNCCLRNISISQGSDDSSDIYRAVRISFTNGVNTKIFKADSATVLPAVSATAISNTDPALVSGGQSNSTFSFPILGSTTVDDVSTYYVTEVLVKIWVEGQHQDAKAAFAGTGFTISMSFQSY